MKVWCVWKEYPTLDAVDDELQIYLCGVSELVAICETKEKAEAMVQDLREHNEDPEPDTSMEDQTDDGEEDNDEELDGPRPYYVEYCYSEQEVI